MCTPLGNLLYFTPLWSESDYLNYALNVCQHFGLVIENQSQGELFAGWNPYSRLTSYHPISGYVSQFVVNVEGIVEYSRSQDASYLLPLLSKTFLISFGLKFLRWVLPFFFNTPTSKSQWLVWRTYRQDKRSNCYSRRLCY